MHDVFKLYDNDDMVRLPHRPGQGLGQWESLVTSILSTGGGIAKAFAPQPKTPAAPKPVTPVTPVSTTPEWVWPVVVGVGGIAVVSLLFVALRR